MFRIILFLTLMLIVSACNKSPQSQTNDHKEAENQSSPDLSSPQVSSTYDEALATRLGADDYGMSQYVMAFLKKGPNRPTDEKKAAELQAAHMANIRRLSEEGKLAMAGPFLDDGELRGIYIFNVKTIAEAEALTKTDPAIQTGSLVMELHPWYGSAGLKEVKSIHEKIGKIKI